MALGVISDFYGPQDTFARQLQNQSAASPGIGYEAARLADPFGNERKQYQNQLSTLMTNPGSFESSPFYKFAYDQGLESIQRKGNVRSGNKLAQLMKYGQGMASQHYFPQANLLSTLSGATTGSPAAAGLAVSGAFERSQNLANLASANKAAGQNPMGGASPMGGGAFNTLNDAVSRHYQQLGYGSGGAGVGGSTGYSGAPAGGYGGGFAGSSYYSGSAVPLSNAGTGYMSSDYGTYNFGSSAPGDSYYTPNYSTPSYSDYSSNSYDPYAGYDYGSYDPYGYSDYGYSDYGYGGGWDDWGYDDYGWE